MSLTEQAEIRRWVYIVFAENECEVEADGDDLYRDLLLTPIELDEILAALGTEFNVPIKEQEVSKFKTVGDLIRCIDRLERTRDGVPEKVGSDEQPKDE